LNTDNSNSTSSRENEVNTCSTGGIYSGPYHRKFISNSESYSSPNQNSSAKEGKISNIIRNSLLDEPFISKLGKSSSVKSSLLKLSEAMAELSLAEKNMDEKVLYYILNNLRNE